MAENTIDNLSIQVVASAERAISTFNRLASGASGLRGAARGAAGSMQDMAQGARDAGTATQEAGTQAGSATISVGRFWNALRGVGSRIGGFFVQAVHRGTAAVGTFLQSIARIAFYRAIRSIIKDLGQSFKDLYGYSRMFGTDFARSMDRITTASVYLRNSLAAMVAPLVNLFAPALDMLADKIVDILNFVNQLFAAINGQETYTVAKKVATTWESTFDSAANHANRRIKEVRNTLLGFDEINRLNGETPSSSWSTGSSPYTPGYSTMFEEKPLEGFFQKISGFTSGMPDWLKWLLGGTALVGGFLLIKKFIPWLLKKIGELFAFKIPDWIKWLFGPKGDGDGGLDIPKDIDLPDGEITVDLKQGDWSVLDDITGKDLPVNIVPSQSAKTIFDTLVNAWNNIDGKVLYITIMFTQKATYLFTTLVNAWNGIPGKTLFVNVALSQKATYLWETLKNAWDSIPNKTLYANVSLSQKANFLWTTLKDAWDNIKDKVLYSNVSLSQKANYLWTTLSNAWDGIKNKVLYADVMLSQKANYLWTTLSNAWGSIQGKVLYVDVMLSQKANYLWTTLSNAWNGIQNKVLYTEVMLSQKANYLWTILSNAWDGIQGKVLYVNVEFSQKANYLWTTLQSAWDNIQNKVLYANVSLSQKATYLWDTLKKAWNSIQNKVVYLNVSLSQSANYLWTTLKNAWDGIQNKVVYANVSLSQSANYLWTTLKSAWDNIQGKVVYLTVEFTQKANYLWTTLKNAWDGIKDKVLYVEVKLKKNGWTTVTDFVDNSFGGATGGGGKTSGGGVGRGGRSVPVDLQVNATGGTGTTVSKAGIISFSDISSAIANVKAQASKGIGTKVTSTGTVKLTDIEKGSTSITVGASAKWASLIGGLITYLQIDNLSTDIKALAKKGWGTKTFKGAVGASDTSTTITAKLNPKFDTNDPLTGLGLKNLTAVIKTKLVKTANNKIEYSFSGGGTDKNVKVFELSKNGAVFVNGVRHNIPQYAGGTTNAHGSLFWAGEAGPEIVGHVGGRTEVLNKSQLASAMYSAVQAAMAPAAANFASAAQSMGVADAGVDMETLAEMVRQGVEQAMGRQNELDRQRNEYLRQINEKDYNPEISTSSINRAQQRMNRRAGTTIVPVGT